MKPDAADALKFAICLPTVTEPRIRGGGHLHTMRFAQLLGEHCQVRLVSYERPEEGVWFLPDAEARLIAEGYTLLLTWGPDVNRLLKQYHGSLPVVFYQQSTDWGVDLPPDVPILSTSKYLMTYAQLRWPANPQLYMPPAIAPGCINLHRERDIDVLVIKRKMTPYILETLLPALREHCKVHLVERFIPQEELFELFNRSKVYVYAFAPQRSQHAETGWRMMEGFGLQVLEAIVCGCTVFTNLRGGMTDFVEPPLVGHCLECYAPQWDRDQILKAVRAHPHREPSGHARVLLERYGEAAFHERAAYVLANLRDFFAAASDYPPEAQSFRIPEPIPMYQAWGEQILTKLRRSKPRWLRWRR